MPKYSIVAEDGTRQEIEVDLRDYKAAAEQGISLAQHLNRTYRADTRHGTTFEQCMQAANLFIRPDKETGIRPPTMKAVLEGDVLINAGGIVRNDGANNNTPSGRLLFPEVIMQVIESELSESNEDFLGGFDQMIAQTAFVTSPKVDQPVIDVTAPKDNKYRSQPVAQLAEPASLVTITVSETSRRIPTKGIGLTISDEALQATSLDLVGIAMTQQARQERVRVVEDALTAMINGDADLGETALTSVKANSFDSSITNAGELTQKAWIKYLRANYRRMNISNIICDIDTALAIENRVGKPTQNTDDPNSPRIDTLFSVDNLGVNPPRVLLVDTSVIGANTVVGLDNRYAIRRVVNVSAQYSAIEQYVMRRATSFRVDYGEISHKLMTDAWSVMTLTL